MKTIKLKGGSEKMYKPHEAASMLGYHPRTVRRFIHDGKIKAVDTNKGGKQPVWWITEKEIQKQLASIAGKPNKTTPKKKKK